MTTPNLYLQETYINQTKGHRIGDGGIYETAYTEPGTLYRELQKEYGGCISAVYMERESGPSKRIGWVFLSRQPYERAPRYDRERHGTKTHWRERWTYLREVWCTVHSAPPTRTIREYPMDLDEVRHAT